MINFFKDVKSDIVERVRSAYGGTFVLVWIFWNWRLPFFFLFLSNDGKYLYRQVQLEIAARGTNNLLWWPMLLTLLSIAIFGLLSSFSASIVTFFQLNFRPRLTSRFAPKTVVRAESYENLKTKYRELESFESEHKMKFLSIKDELRDANKMIELAQQHLAAINEKRSLAVDEINVHRKVITEILSVVRPLVIPSFDVNTRFDNLKIFDNKFRYVLSATGSWTMTVPSNLKNTTAIHQKGKTAFWVINVEGGEDFIFFNGEQFYGRDLHGRFVFYGERQPDETLMVYKTDLNLTPSQ